jgi:hypothetical protein
MRVLRRILIGMAAWGAALVGTALAVRSTVDEFGDGSDGAFSVVAALDGREFASTSPSLSSGVVTTCLGGAEIDLRGAAIGASATLKLRSFMGGIDVIVPADWRVELSSMTIMAGISNLTDPDGVDRDAPVLVVDAILVMSGAEIHTAEAA